MCEDCRKRFVAFVVQENTDQAYRGFVTGAFHSEEQAAASLVRYAELQYDLMCDVIGNPHGDSGEDTTLEDWLDDSTRH